MAVRRRGSELEDALLDAGWEQLLAEGYGGFTIDAVAQRAQTSKPVLYRRWPSREALLVAVLAHRRGDSPIPVPDTGALRTDVIELLRRANWMRNVMAAVFSAQLGTYFEETGSTPATLRQQLLGDRVTAMTQLVRRAIDRGEIAGELPARVIELPLDLCRHEVLMTLEPVPEDTIIDIVDTIFMPLVAAISRA